MQYADLLPLSNKALQKITEFQFKHKKVIRFSELTDFLRRSVGEATEIVNFLTEIGLITSSTEILKLTDFGFKLTAHKFPKVDYKRVIFQAMLLGKEDVQRAFDYLRRRKLHGVSPHEMLNKKIASSLEHADRILTLLSWVGVACKNDGKYYYAWPAIAVSLRPAMDHPFDPECNNGRGITTDLHLVSLRGVEVLVEWIEAELRRFKGRKHEAELIRRFGYARWFEWKYRNSSINELLDDYLPRFWDSSAYTDYVQRRKRDPIKVIEDVLRFCILGEQLYDKVTKDKLMPTERKIAVKLLESNKLIMYDSILNYQRTIENLKKTLAWQFETEQGGRFTELGLEVMYVVQTKDGSLNEIKSAYFQSLNETLQTLRQYFPPEGRIFLNIGALVFVTRKIQADLEAEGFQPHSARVEAAKWAGKIVQQIVTNARKWEKMHNINTIITAFGSYYTDLVKEYARAGVDYMDTGATMWIARRGKLIGDDGYTPVKPDKARDAWSQTKLRGLEGTIERHIYNYQKFLKAAIDLQVPPTGNPQTMR